MKIKDRPTDNVIEILSKIVEFTDLRGKVLHKNIINIETKDYRPADLDAVTFADLMGRALSEHLICDRLILIDSENIKFGLNGTFEALPVIDDQACELLACDTKQYLKYQMKKISENRKNKNAAIQLIQQKQARKRNYINNKN